MSVPFLLAVSVGGASCLATWLPRARRRGRSPSHSPARTLCLSSAANLLIASLALAALIVGRGRLLPLHDLGFGKLAPALLLGALGGLFIHVTGGGSPLPLGVLQPAEFGTASPLQHPLGAGGALLLGGAVGEELIWRGIVLSALALVLPGLIALLLAACGYGLQRWLAGEDHAALATTDGILLGAVFRVSGSLPSAVIAHVVADLFAYASLADLAGVEPLAGE
jgi:membrane protease YdiL (CAAX protease family)